MECVLGNVGPRGKAMARGRAKLASGRAEPNDYGTSPCICKAIVTICHGRDSCGTGVPHEADPLSDDADVGSLKALGPSVYVELHDLSFRERSKAVGLNGALMAEDVVSAVLFDESKALCVVEPLHCSNCHDVSFSFFRRFASLPSWICFR